LPQRLEIRHASLDVRPDVLEQAAITRVAVRLGSEEHELAGAVVLRHRITAALVDATWHLAAREEVMDVPAQVVGGDVGVAQSQQ